ncbi:MAG: hypothetical protein WCB04_12600 [Mycobacteriales bacterium]
MVVMEVLGIWAVLLVLAGASWIALRTVFQARKRARGTATVQAGDEVVLTRESTCDCDYCRAPGHAAGTREPRQDGPVECVRMEFADIPAHLVPMTPDGSAVLTAAPHHIVTVDLTDPRLRPVTPRVPQADHKEQKAR